MKLYKTKMLEDLRKLNEYELFALIHLAFWEVDHDCGKGCHSTHFTDTIQRKLDKYCYYDTMRFRDDK